MTDEPDALNLIEAGLQAETFLGSALAGRLAERAQREANQALKDILSVDISLSSDEYKTEVVALVMEVNKRENALHWINDTLREFIAHEEVMLNQEPYDDD